MIASTRVSAVLAVKLGLKTNTQKVSLHALKQKSEINSDGTISFDRWWTPKSKNNAPLDNFFFSKKATFFSDFFSYTVIKFFRM